MRRSLAVLLVTTLSASLLALAARAQEPRAGLPVTAPPAPIDWQRELARDLVTTKGKTLVIDEYGQLDFGAAPRRRVNMRWHAEAPARSFISRDAFVATFNSLQTMMVLTFVVGERPVTMAELADFAYEPLPDLAQRADAPVDVDFRFVLTKDGVDVAIATDGAEPTRSTMTWGQIYKRREVKSAAGLSMVPAPPTKLPATCQRYLKGFRACIGAMPAAAREMAYDSLNNIERTWLAAKEPAQLDGACREVLDAARRDLRAVCPANQW